MIPTPDLDLAARLFDALAVRTRRGPGIERDSYGPGEQAAHDLAAEAARSLGLDVSVDAIGNLLVVLPGRDRTAPMVLIGSHLDSVPRGGNFDGAAGVVAGLSILASLVRTGALPARDVGVMAIRAEESAWYDVPYIGSAGLFGLLDPACLAVRRSDGLTTLGEAMAAGGFDPGAVAGRRRLLDPARLAAYLELHIEQGPVLVGEDRPVAVVTGIRGCRRLRDARCVGAYGHSGALPRAYRRDAVAATVALLSRVEAEWLRAEAAGADLVVTTGEFTTDPAQHGPSKVPGETRFVVDIRSVADGTMEALEAAVRARAAEVEAEYRVRFDLGAASYSPPAVLDAGLQATLRAAMVEVGAPPFAMASGAGHDAAVFASVGVPTAMLFVRNQNGSHNPDEAMDFDDFAQAARALWVVVRHLAN